MVCVSSYLPFAVKINKREKEKEMTTGGLSPLLLSSVDIAIISLKEKLSSQV